MRFGSVCSGIEAASTAWHPLGWRASFLSEIEAFPRAVLQHHYPETPLHGDFTTIEAGQYEPIDLLVGGTPCQSFSVAGLRGGLGDDRGNLALEYLRLADRLRPRWLVWENVPGVLSSNGGRDFGAILGGMVELGYGFAYRVLDAQFFGVAQRRRRVFVVGHLGDWRRAAAVLFERHSLQGHPSPRREAGQSAPTIPSRSSAGGGLGTDFDCDGGLIAGTLGTSSAAHPSGVKSEADFIVPVAYGGNNTAGPIEVATALSAHGGPMGRMDFESETFVAQVAPALSASNPYGDNESREGLLVCFSSKDHGGDAEHDLSPTLRAGGFDGSHANAGVPPAIAFALRGREGGAMPEVGGDQIGALRSASGGSSRDYVAFAHQGGGVQTRLGYDPEAGTVQTLSANQTPAVAGSAVRRLTPRECERLQGFPDDYTLIPWRRGMAPDGPRYKALGNSMAVPVMAWIGRRIEAVEQLIASQARAA
jgi:DNA (cytosine-5)-methyltransferase 1